MSGSRIIATTIAGPLAVATGIVSITDTGGVTAGTYAVTASGGSLVNAGLLSGSGSGLLESGGSSDNLAGGRVIGGSVGVSLSGGALLTNSGLLSGGSAGIVGAGFVTNYGTIAAAAASGYAVSFAAGATASLIVEPGARFLGTVAGGGAASTVEFAGTAAGTLHGLGSAYTGFGQADVALGATWTAGGTNVVAGMETVTVYGKLVSSGTFINAGAIRGVAGGLGVGVYVAGGSLTNAGTLYGDTSGIRAPYGLGATITNTGLVAAAGVAGTGVYLYDATFFNLAGGRVSGATGIDLGASGSFANYATVSGAITGAYMAGGAIANEAGAVIAGASTGIGGYGGVINAGTIEAATASGFAISFAGSADSLLIVDPGAVFVGTVDGGGVAGASPGSTIEFASGAGTFAGFGASVVGFAQVSLDAGADWLLAGSAAGFGGGETISGLASGSTIELTGTSESYGALAGGVLTLTGGTTLALPGVTHALVSAGDGDTFITACLATGTGILTAAGRVAVEALRTGDKVFTVSGRLATIGWIGWRRTNLASHPRPSEVMPVRVRAGAFGEGVPWRDVVLSPDHAVLVDGALIPIRLLVNGASIVGERRDAVTYWHLELDRHDILLAEGLACESYLDTGNRAAFDNAPGVVALAPDFVPGVFARGVWAREGCVGILTDPAEPRLRAAHTRLLLRARRAVARERRLRLG